jgi:5'-3' exonuclease
MTDLIVDGNSLYARSWFAATRIPGNNPVQSVRLGLQTLIFLLNPERNRLGTGFNRMLIGWDGQPHEEKQREPKPPEYYEFRDIFKEVLHDMFQCANCEIPPYEGDDIVATAVAHSKADKIYIVSGDKDLQQLRTDTAEYYCLNTKGVLSEAFILNKWRVKRPSQIALALAVIGDNVDRIKGIPNWGPKKCEKLFEAITPEMNFEQALAAIDAQVPADLKIYFWESLERTLLNCDVPGVPTPAEIVMLEPSVVDDMDIPGVSVIYHELYRQIMEEPY